MPPLLPNAVKLRITIRDIDPVPWREIDIRLSSNLNVLHNAIQAAFLWQDEHLWEFVADDKRYGTDFDADEGADIRRARLTRVEQLIENNPKKLRYIYDFGDYWVHDMEVVSLCHVNDEDRLPRFLSGENSAPPENIGGPPGYDEFLKNILNNPKHPERENYAHILEDPLYGKFDPHDLREEAARFSTDTISRRKPRRA